MEGLVMPSQTFWRGKRVLVTGHTGFKGSWLCLWLKRLGASVTGFALPPPTAPSLFERARVYEGMTSVIGDIRDLALIQRLMIECRPEVVVHLAAQSLVRCSYINPVDTYMINVIGTVHLLEAVRQAGGVHVVVNVTSDKCYENQESIWGCREIDPMGGRDPYSSSKGCAELVTAAWRASFFSPDDYIRHGVALGSARAGNVIGGGDWADDRLVPDLIKAFTAGGVAAIRNPDAIRPWQHVLDPLSGYLRLVERLWTDGPTHAEGWNFGPAEGDARPVAWVADRLAALWGNGARWALDREAHPHEAHILRLDCSKARERLGWVPRRDLDWALRATVAWYQAEQAGADMQMRTVAQIDEYESVALAHQ